MGGFQPVLGAGWRFIRFPAFVGQECPTHTCQIQTIRVGDPSQAAGCYSCDAEVDSVALTQILLAVLEQLQERPVDIAEAEEAEVVGMDADPSGAKARSK